MIELLSNVLPAGWRFERRRDYSTARGYAFKVVGVLLALGVTAVIIAIIGQSPWNAALRVVRGTLGSAYGLQQLFILATPLLICAVGYMLGERMQIYNVGLEGQLFMGAWAATGVGLFVKGPTALVLILMLLAGAAGGAVLMLAPAWLRIKAGVSEVLTTLLLNFAAVYWVQYFAVSPWKDTGKWSSFVQTGRIGYELPYLWGELHIGILIAAVIVVALFFVLGRTVWGYEVTTVGGNRRVAEFAGIPVLRHMFTVMLLSGAIAGVSGAIEVAGTTHRLHQTVSINYGWNGLMVSLIAGSAPLVIVPAGLFMALILNGGIILNTQGVPIHIVTVIIGLILVFVCLGEWMANYRLTRVTRVPQERRAEYGVVSDAQAAETEG